MKLKGYTIKFSWFWRPWSFALGFLYWNDAYEGSIVRMSGILLGPFVLKLYKEPIKEEMSTWKQIQELSKSD